MAERKPASPSRSKSNTKPKVTSPQQKADQATAEQSDASVLDNPLLPDRPSELRHGIYFVGVVIIGIALNFVVLLLISGGR